MMVKQIFLVVIGLMAGVTVAQAEGWEVISATGDIPAPRYGHSLTLLDDMYYLFGGIAATEGGELRAGARIHNVTALMSDLYEYNPRNKHFRRLHPEGDQPPPMSGHVAYQQEDQTMYVTSGHRSDPNNTNSYVYNPRNNRWDRRPGPPFRNRVAAGATVMGVTCMLAGGFDDETGDVSNEVWKYDSNTGIWSKASEFPSGQHVYGQAMLNYDGYMYQYGGRNQDGPINDFWRFNPANNSWDFVFAQGASPMPRYDGAMFNTGANFWLMGGRGYAMKRVAKGSPREAWPEEDYGEVWQLKLTKNGYNTSAEWVAGPTGQPFSQAAGFAQPAVSSARADQATYELLVFGGVHESTPLTLAEIPVCVAQFEEVPTSTPTIGTPLPPTATFTEGPPTETPAPPTDTPANTPTGEAATDTPTNTPINTITQTATTAPTTVGCATPVIGDLNGDCQVNTTDLMIFLQQWRERQP